MSNQGKMANNTNVKSQNNTYFTEKKARFRNYRKSKERDCMNFGAEKQGFWNSTDRGKKTANLMF
ncbi:hypothetical protein K340107D12_45300 [Blautia parvula]|uniref:Uncharacterized protein n=1 Tax=Blautia parvula TaxID=2877527 RepID=A0ABQ0BYW4_9FIRM